MPRLGKEDIYVSDPHDRDTQFNITIEINVNAQGEFTTTLAEKDVKDIEAFGIELGTNGRRGARKGFFANDTKKGLVDDVKAVLLRCLSREMIDEKLVIRYSFFTTASFAFTVDGKIIPNMGWQDDGEPDQNLGWQNGTKMTHAVQPEPIGVQMYVKPYWRRVFKYLDNREKIEYHELTAFGSNEAKENQYYLKWLENICSTKRPSYGSMQEVEYTEERAKFFVNMFQSLCKLAHSIAKFEEPEAMLKLIDSGNYLMPHQESNGDDFQRHTEET